MSCVGCSGIIRDLMDQRDAEAAKWRGLVQQNIGLSQQSADVRRERDELRAELAIARGEVERLKHDGLGQARMSFATRTENAKLRELLREVMSGKSIDRYAYDCTGDETLLYARIMATLAEGGGT